MPLDSAHSHGGFTGHSPLALLLTTVCCGDPLSCGRASGRDCVPGQMISPNRSVTQISCVLSDRAAVSYLPCSGSSFLAHDPGFPAASPAPLCLSFQQW